MDADANPVDEPSEPSEASPAPGSIADRSAAVIARDAGEAAPTLPSPLARVIGFVSILLAGAAGAFIGYAITDLQCTGDCTVNSGIGGLVGAIIAAVGVGIVVQLALKAMHEWRTVQATGGAAAERQRQKARERRAPAESRGRPRVR
jgi:hypothetical protein